MICECCGQRRETLPFHHEFRDGDGQDYCQECYDAGCDDECAVAYARRKEARGGS